MAARSRLVPIRARARAAPRTTATPDLPSPRRLLAPVGGYALTRAIFTARGRRPMTVLILGFPRRGSFSADFGLHGRVKPPACEGRILVGGPPVRKVVSLCASLARLGSLWLKRSQTQQGEPVRMALPSHHFARAFALALRASTADEAVMVQVKLQ